MKKILFSILTFGFFLTSCSSDDNGGVSGAEETVKLLPTAIHFDKGDIVYEYDEQNRLIMVKDVNGAHPEITRFIYTDNNVSGIEITYYENNKEIRTDIQFDYVSDNKVIAKVQKSGGIPGRDATIIIDKNKLSSLDENYSKITYTYDGNGNFIEQSEYFPTVDITSINKHVYDSEKKGIFRHCQTPMWAIQVAENYEMLNIEFFMPNLVSLTEYYADSGELGESLKYEWNAYEQGYPRELKVIYNDYISSEFVQNSKITYTEVK